LSLCYGGAGYKVVETAGCVTAAKIFSPEIRSRGWPAQDKVFLPCMITAEAEQRIRSVILAAFHFASGLPASAVETEALLGLKETLLAAIDNALADPLPFETSKVGKGRAGDQRQVRRADLQRGACRRDRRLGPHHAQRHAAVPRHEPASLPAHQTAVVGATAASWRRVAGFGVCARQWVLAPRRVRPVLCRAIRRNAVANPGAGTIDSPVNAKSE
jgi:hypothetical protein